MLGWRSGNEVIIPMRHHKALLASGWWWFSFFHLFIPAVMALSAQYRCISACGTCQHTAMTHVGSGWFSQPWMWEDAHMAMVCCQRFRLCPHTVVIEEVEGSQDYLVFLISRSCCFQLTEALQVQTPPVPPGPCQPPRVVGKPKAREVQIRWGKLCLCVLINCV